MRDQTAATTWREVATDARERIAAVLADLDDVIEARKPDTHYTDCHLDHAECLAARIRATLTGEDPDRA